MEGGSKPKILGNLLIILQRFAMCAVVNLPSSSRMSDENMEEEDFTRDLGKMVVSFQYVGPAWSLVSQDIEKLFVSFLWMPEGSTKSPPFCICIGLAWSFTSQDVQKGETLHGYQNGVAYPLVSHVRQASLVSHEPGCGER